MGWLIYHKTSESSQTEISVWLLSGVCNNSASLSNIKLKFCNNMFYMHIDRTSMLYFGNPFFAKWNCAFTRRLSISLTDVIQISAFASSSLTPRVGLFEDTC